MYKVMIIEDEQIERETLQQIIEEYIPQCVPVLAAKNGREALQLYEEHHPDIVLADINIPGINGLDVIRRIKEDSADTEFLILSSYNYFEYAQEAIRLGVDDFILKPYNIEHLKEAVEKVILHIQQKKDEMLNQNELLDKIEKITPVLENDCLFGILSNENERVLRRSLRLLDPTICSGFCYLIKSAHYDSAYIQEVSDAFKTLGYRPMKELFHGLKIFFVLSDHVIEKKEVLRIAEVMQDIKREDCQYGIGPIVHDIAKFHHSFIVARDRVGVELPVLEQLVNESHESEQMDDVNQLCEAFLPIFQKMDEEGLKREITQLALRFMQKDKDQIQEEVPAFLEELKERANAEYPAADLLSVVFPPLHITNNIHQEVSLYLHLNMHKIYDRIVEERFKNTNLLVKQAIRYIDQNYRRQITLSDMADALHVSPYYVSKLLNNTLNKTFTELIAERRVEASKELLKTNKRIKEIAYEVGFQGQNYFTKIFKKYTGVTPKTYKNTFEEQ